MSGEVRSVKAVDGGAEPKASAKTSCGDTVRIDAETADMSVMLVKTDAEFMVNCSGGKPGIRLAPESNELLLFKSAMVAAFGCCGIFVLELGNKGTGGRCNGGCWNSVVELGAEFA